MYQKMKFFVVLLSIIGLAHSALDIPEHLKSPLRIMRKACMAESGVEEKHIIASRDGVIIDDPQLKCYILCLLEHSGMIEEDGTIHFNDVYHLLTPSMQKSVDKVVAKCETIHGSTRCETAYLTVKCYVETEPEGAELP